MLQIFGNMISNALKFTEKKGKVTVALAFEDAYDSKAKLTFSVKDNGVGMTEDQINNMLNHQATSTPGTDNERGFGFGFQLSKHLISTLKGSLEISSESGIGSEIKVTVPVKLFRQIASV